MKNVIKKLGAISIAATLSLSIMSPTTAMAAVSQVNPEYQSRFESMYNKIKDTSNGYFSSDGVPYHSVETLMVEAPDYGHVTTSEAFSYYIWLEAMYGRFSGDFTGFKKSWDTAEKYIIPSEKDQLNTSMSRYDTNRPATYAPEYQDPSKYPSKLDTGAAVGKDPIHQELVSAYGTSTMYTMHWLLDVDNWYGYGNRGDGTSKNSYINTFQRGEQESTWETVPHPSWEAMKWGGTNGFLDLFTGDQTYSKQFRYTNAPDADARAIQATYWANRWAKEQGQDVSTYVSKASKMGDYLRYNMFDKYFRKIGSSSQAGTGYDACTYLMNWYCSWGGSLNGDWSWKIGSSHNHFGYQNPFTAWVLSSNSDFKPKSTNGATDWGKSLSKQIEFYKWLQSAEGAIAGGATNSYNGRYEAIPSGTSTFDGMAYVENPVYADPGSNTWFGMQAWSMQRVAEYYYQTKDVKVKDLLDKWAKWANSVIKFNSDGTFQIPNTISWTGQPDTWTGTPTGNQNLHVSIVNYGTDLGVASSLANTLTYYAAASGDRTSQENAKKLLDGIWDNYQDTKGVSVPEVREDYHRLLDQEVYIPSGWTGTMANGDQIKSGIKFIDIRSKYRQDPDWAKVSAALNAGKAPTMTYHRFWAQSEFAVANGVYAILFPTPTPILGDVNGDKTVDSLDYALLKKYILDSSTTIITANADLNSDDAIDAIDLVQLKIKILSGN